MDKAEEEALQGILHDSLVDIGVLQLAVIQLLSLKAQEDENPQEALRRLSDSLNAAIDLMPFGRGSQASDRYIEAHRKSIDQLILATAKLVDASN